jgi:hypothetical protein
MNDITKTHYRKAFDSPYLSSADIVESTTLTIKSVSLERDKTKKTKELFNTAYFVEQDIRPGEKLKPMILNATNSKKMKSITGSAFIDDWSNVRVCVYVDHNVRFGSESVEGLRIAEARAVPKAPPSLIKAADDAAKKGIAKYKAFWQGSSAADRTLLEPYHDDNKAKAIQADAKKAEQPEVVE